MKKFFQSKGFIVSALAVLCVAILGICWFVSRDRTEEFRPNESPPAAPAATGRMAVCSLATEAGAQMPMRPVSLPAPKRNIPR